MPKKTLKIPKDDQAGLMLLCKVENDAFIALLSEANSKLEENTAVQGLTKDESERLWGTITTMHVVRQRHEVEVSEFVSDITESLKESKVLQDSQRALLHDRLVQLLSIGSLIIAAKSVALGNEHQNRFCEARIFTDLRPVFGTNIDEQTKTMVVTHQLKISYHQRAPRELHSIYLALGSDDLTELRSLLDREEKKIQTIKSSLSASNITFVDADHQGGA